MKTYDMDLAEANGGTFDDDDDDMYRLGGAHGGKQAKAKATKGKQEDFDGLLGFGDFEGMDGQSAPAPRNTKKKRDGPENKNNRGFGGDLL